MVFFKFRSALCIYIANARNSEKILKDRKISTDFQNFGILVLICELNININITHC
jgi:hypothetical protein